MLIPGTNMSSLKVVALVQIERILLWQLGDCKMKRPRNARGHPSFVLWYRRKHFVVALLSIEEILWNCFRGILSVFM